MISTVKSHFSTLAKTIQSLQPKIHKTPISIHQSLALLRETQHQGIYAKVIINGKPFTITPGDLLLTHRFRNTQIGDVIQLNKVYELGTENFVLRQNARYLRQLENEFEKEGEGEGEVEVEKEQVSVRNELNERIFLNPIYYNIQGTIVAHDRGDKVHRKIVKRRKKQLPSKNLKPHTTLLRIRCIEIK